jgi:hypothetical protein
MVHAHSRRTSCAASEVRSPNHRPGDLSAAETRFEPYPDTTC